MRVLKDAPAPGAGTTHLVGKLVSYLQAMMDRDTDSAYTEMAYGVNFDSNSSKEEHKPHGRNHKKSQRSKSCGICKKSKKD
jgi:hypothetical protein